MATHRHKHNIKILGILLFGVTTLVTRAHASCPPGDYLDQAHGFCRPCAGICGSQGNGPYSRVCIINCPEYACSKSQYYDETDKTCRSCDQICTRILPAPDCLTRPNCAEWYLQRFMEDEPESTTQAKTQKTTSSRTSAEEETTHDDKLTAAQPYGPTTDPTKGSLHWVWWLLVAALILVIVMLLLCMQIFWGTVLNLLQKVPLLRLYRHVPTRDADEVEVEVTSNDAPVQEETSLHNQLSMVPATQLTGVSVQPSLASSTQSLHTPY